MRRARVWALVSLLAGLGVVLAVVVFLVRNGLYVVMGLAGLALGVAGAWWAITERGARHVVGIVVAVARRGRRGDRAAPGR